MSKRRGPSVGVALLEIAKAMNRIADEMSQKGDISKLYHAAQSIVAAAKRLGQPGYGLGKFRSDIAQARCVLEGHE